MKLASETEDKEIGYCKNPGNCLPFLQALAEVLKRIPRVSKGIRISKVESENPKSEIRISKF